MKSEPNYPWYTKKSTPFLLEAKKSDGEEPFVTKLKKPPAVKDLTGNDSNIKIKTDLEFLIS